LLSENLNTKYQITKQSYDQNVEDYVKNTFKTSPPPLREFINTIPKGGKVVDLGCGPGRDSRSFIETGLDYLGIDFSEDTVKKARELNPNAHFEVDDFMNLHFKNKSIDAFWAIASLYHLNKIDFKKFLHNLYQFLKNEGQAFIVMKKGKGEHFDYDTRYKTGKKFVSYYSKDELEEIYTKVGFQIKEIFVVNKDEVNNELKNNYEKYI
jgi:SAM-dependent methyltransferase